MVSPTAFPFLTPGEFQDACGSLVAAVEMSCLGPDSGWLDVNLRKEVSAAFSFDDLWGHHDGATDANVFLVIKGRVRLRGGLENGDGLGLAVPEPRSQDDAGHRTEDGDDEVHEDDPERLAVGTATKDKHLVVEYHALLSPVYRVPVLYLCLRGDMIQQQPSIEAAYEYLVPEQHRPSLGADGVLGGLSMTYHPVHDTPFLFLHPCRTAEAMRSVSDHVPSSPESYLMVWLGLMGPSVGLSLPVEVAHALRQMESQNGIP